MNVLYVQNISYAVAAPYICQYVFVLFKKIPLLVY